MQEATLVEAKVIVEPSKELAVTFHNGSIDANFDALNAYVENVLRDYDGWEPSPDNASDVKLCKSERKYLNALAREIDERRKAVKAEYSRPLMTFETHANKIRDKILDAAARLNEVAKQAEAAEKAHKRNELKSYYEEYAPFLALPLEGQSAPLVPYERIEDVRWLNKSTPMKKAIEEIEQTVAKVKSGEESLSALKLAHCTEAMAEFFATLDVQKAIERDCELTQQEERQKALEAERAARAQAVETQVEQRVVEPEYPPYEPDLGDAPYVPQGYDAPQKYAISYTATPEQDKAVVDFAKSLGLMVRRVTIHA